MSKDFERLDELMAKDEADFTAEETADMERLSPLLADPEYQKYRCALIEAAEAEATEKKTLTMIGA
jgi:hypothetical protein